MLHFILFTQTFNYQIAFFSTQTSICTANSILFVSKMIFKQPFQRTF